MGGAFSSRKSALVLLTMCWRREPSTGTGSPTFRDQPSKGESGPLRYALTQQPRKTWELTISSRTNQVPSARNQATCGAEFPPPHRLRAATLAAAGTAAKVAWRTRNEAWRASRSAWLSTSPTSAIPLNRLEGAATSVMLRLRRISGRRVRRESALEAQLVARFDVAAP